MQQTTNRRRLSRPYACPAAASAAPRLPWASSKGWQSVASSTPSTISPQCPAEGIPERGWLGNPGQAGSKTWRKEGPTSAIASIVREAFSLTDDTSQYVYLSDGGHFENLGIYEMVRRRCRYIVVSDAGCDPKFT